MLVFNYRKSLSVPSLVLEACDLQAAEVLEITNLYQIKGRDGCQDIS